MKLTRKKIKVVRVQAIWELYHRLLAKELAKEIVECARAMTS